MGKHTGVRWKGLQLLPLLPNIGARESASDASAWKFHQAPGLLGNVAFFFSPCKGVCVSSLRVQRGPSPDFALLSAKAKWEKGDSSHWPQAEAAALRREGKTYKKLPISTPGEWERGGGAFL